jgi:hypothetical protein
MSKKIFILSSLDTGPILSLSNSSREVLMVVSIKVMNWVDSPDLSLLASAL